MEIKRNSSVLAFVVFVLLISIFFSCSAIGSSLPFVKTEKITDYDLGIKYKIKKDWENIDTSQIELLASIYIKQFNVDDFGINHVKGFLDNSQNENFFMFNIAISEKLNRKTKREMNQIIKEFPTLKIKGVEIKGVEWYINNLGNNDGNFLFYNTIYNNKLYIVFFYTNNEQHISYMQDTIKSVNIKPFGLIKGFGDGFFLPFTFIGSLFINDIHLYKSPNNGSSYGFGFWLGIILLLTVIGGLIYAAMDLNKAPKSTAGAIVKVFTDRKKEQFKDAKYEYKDTVSNLKNKVNKYNDTLEATNNTINNLNIRRISTAADIKEKIQLISSHISIGDRDYIKDTLKNCAIPGNIISDIVSPLNRDIRIAEQNIDIQAKNMIKDFDYASSLLPNGKFELIAGTGIMALSAISNYLSMQENIDKIEEKKQEIKNQISKVRREMQKLKTVNTRINEIEKSFDKAVEAFNYACNKVYTIIFTDGMSEQQIAEKRNAELKTFSIEERNYLRELCQATKTVIDIICSPIY